ncbi:MAG: hypothetical protein ACK583_05745, partial [Cyanobacteriota bacterium]
MAFCAIVSSDKQHTKQKRGRIRKTVLVQKQPIGIEPFPQFTRSQAKSSMLPNGRRNRKLGWAGS